MRIVSSKHNQASTLNPDCTLAEVVDLDTEDLYYGGERLTLLNASLVKLINAIMERKLLAALETAGTIMLAKRKVLDEATYTTPLTQWSTKYNMSMESEDPFRAIIVLKSDSYARDRHIITAQSIAFLDFTLEICAWFKLFFQNHQEKHARLQRLIKGKIKKVNSDIELIFFIYLRGFN